MYRKRIKKIIAAAAAAVMLFSSSVCSAEEAAPPADTGAAVQPAAPADTSGAGGGEAPAPPADTGASGGGEVPAAPADPGTAVQPADTAPAVPADTSGTGGEETPAAPAAAPDPGPQETDGGTPSSETADPVPAAAEGDSGAADQAADTAAAEKAAADKKAAEQKAAAAAWYYYSRRGSSAGVAADRSASQRKIRKVLLTDETQACIDSLDLMIGRQKNEDVVTTEKTEPEKKKAEKTEEQAPENEVQLIGEWDLPVFYVKALQNLLKKTEKAGCHVGLVMIDIRSGKGVAVNPGRIFYSASSIKGPFIISLAALYPQTMEKQQNAFKAVAVNSDNGAYSGLVRMYGRRFYDAWRKAVGAEAPLTQGDYASCSAEDLARLWLLNYQYITGNPEFGPELGNLFETPNRSAIKPVLKDSWRTQTKAGWIAERNRTAADAGIVYAGEHPYILAMISDYPADLNKLEPYTELMNRIHQELAGGRLTKKRAREYWKE